MRLLGVSFPFVGVAAALACLSGLLVGHAGAQQYDPVENLQQVLKGLTGTDPSDEVLRHRKAALSEAATQLKNISDLRLALALPEWKDNDKDPSTGQPTLLARVDQEVRATIGKRLQNIVQNAVDKGDSRSRLAAANLVGEIGTSIRGLALDDKSGFARSLAPSLVALMELNDPLVRQAAARALGKTNPEPQLAVKALAEMLKSKNVGDRRAASEAQADMVRLIFQASKKTGVQAGVQATDEDVVHCAAAVVPATGACLKDSDVVVRRKGLEALVQAASALRDLMPTTGTGSDQNREQMPPIGRPWTVKEREFVKMAVESLDKKEELFAPLLIALKDQGGAIAKALSDPDDKVRVLSRRALELMGSARLLLNRVREVIPTEKDGTQPTKRRDDVLKEAIEPGLMEFTKRVRDPDVRVRAATVEFLESMEDAAAPAIPTLLLALTDKDRFIRWGAVRTLGKVGKVQTERTVPAIAALLNPDEDPDVREAAATTLRGYGSAAKAALPALIGMLNVGEAEAQEAVLKAITGVGGGGTKEAIPALIKSLQSSSANVRRLAAEALGRMGHLALSALPDLGARLQVEEDSNVRLAICDAILEITRPKE